MTETPALTRRSTGIRLEDLTALLAELDERATALVGSVEIPALLDDLQLIPNAIAELRRSMDPEFHSAASSRVRDSVRQTLRHLERALIYAESRLQHERDSVQVQLHQLDAQREWAAASRQIIW